MFHLLWCQPDSNAASGSKVTLLPSLKLLWIGTGVGENSSEHSSLLFYIYIQSEIFLFFFTGP